jgi:hypothetical protein
MTEKRQFQMRQSGAKGEDAEEKCAREEGQVYYKSKAGICSIRIRIRLSLGRHRHLLLPSNAAGDTPVSEQQVCDQCS